MKLNEATLGSKDKKALIAFKKAMKMKRIQMGVVGQTVMIQIDDEKAIRMRVLSAEIINSGAPSGASAGPPESGAMDGDSTNMKSMIGMGR